MIGYLLLLFLLFPFTQLFPIEAYNQPYALALSALILLFGPSKFLGVPNRDLMALSGLAAIGTILILIELPNEVEMRELLYWISYISPLAIVPATLWVMKANFRRARAAISAAIGMWILVALVQRFIDPSFLTGFVTGSEDLSANIAASGRGVLGFAPEPTHHGLHLICMGTALWLLGGKPWIAGAAVAASVVLAASSFSLLALGAGLIVWAATRPVDRFWFFLAALLVLIGGSMLQYIFEGGTRMAALVNEFQYRGIGVLIVDYSANMRISGIITPLMEAARNFFLPFGISIQQWLETRNQILIQENWVVDLSQNGPASGFGLFIFQAGFLAFPIVFLISKRLLWDFRQRYLGIFTATSFFAFLGQFYLATPSFSLVYAAILYALAHRPEAREPANLVQRPRGIAARQTLRAS